MSLLALLATGGTAAATPVDLRPVAVTPLLASMRPNGRLLATLEVGAGKPYATIGAAIAAAASTQSAKMAAEGMTAITPNYRVDVIVYPGVYDEIVSVGRMIGVYGVASGGVHPKLTHTNQAGISLASTGTLMTGGDVYWEGVDVELVKVAGQESNWPKYSWHHAHGGTTVMVNTHLNTWSSSGVPLTSYGADGGTNGTTVLYACNLGPGNTNSHGPGPVTQCYIDCTGGTLNYNDLGASDGSVLWVVGGNVAGVTASSTTGTTMHLDPATTLTGPVTASGTRDAHTDWPIPTGGMSAHWRSYYGSE